MLFGRLRWISSDIETQLTLPTARYNGFLQSNEIHRETHDRSMLDRVHGLHLFQVAYLNISHAKGPYNFT